MALYQKTCRDRTAEFFSAVEALRGGHQSQNGQNHNAVSYYRRDEFSEVPLISKSSQFSSGPSKGAAASLHEQSVFSKSAAQIGRAIHDVAKKLEELGQMAKSTSLFNDPVQKIQDYTYVIKEDITALNGQIDQLEAYLKQKMGHSAATSEQNERHSQNVVKRLKSELASTTKSFTKILETRNKNLRESTIRSKKFGTGTNLPVRQRKFNSFNMELDDASELEAGTGAGSSGGRSQQQQDQAVLEDQDVYLKHRAEAVQNIEKTIAELSTVYQRLATIVATQHEMVIRIDEDITETAQNVESGYEQLLTYFKSISSNRALILKIFAILIVFIIFFAVFVA